MAKTILPSGEPISVTPEELLKYLNPDGVRQLLRQERLRWNLKPNRDADFIDNIRLFKYSGELHNEVMYQRMEVRTFPDNGAYPGYAGVNIDSGVFGWVHNLEKWDKAISKESLSKIVNRMQIGAMAKIPEKTGYGLDDDDEVTTDTDNRMAALGFDPYDGRIYAFTNDDPNYVNNETRAERDRIPARAVARIGDIPTRVTQLMNDLDFISDPDYRHTDNNFTNSHRYILDNLDDRTFVYPEISKDSGNTYVRNRRVGLSGNFTYGESDGEIQFNSQPDFGGVESDTDTGDRAGERINSYGMNVNYSGIEHESGYLPGIFRSFEELDRVDLVHQRMEPQTHKDAPGAKRTHNYYIMDGKWSPNWFDRFQYNDSYLAQSLNPNNMEVRIEEREPVPYSRLEQTNAGSDMFDRSQLHQWRYNRIDIKYYSNDIVISIVDPGLQYEVGDKLRWTFGDDVFMYVVKTVGPNGQIQAGEYYSERERIFEQDPSTHGVGVRFSNMSGVGHGALLSVSCKVTINVTATQIKNNLYAYVDITPTVRSDNNTEWSDNKMPNSQDGRINIRSTAAGPAYSGVNSGRGGPGPNKNTSECTFHEHGGNATAGVHVHLFRYVIDTQNPKWVIDNGVQVFLGRWVDQGPMGLERPCDIKALLFSNPDTNNFNNYYKFMIDALIDMMNRNHDSVASNNVNSLTIPYLHTADRDPLPEQRFTIQKFDPDSSEYIEVDVTDKVLYINEATGIIFKYNPIYKNDPTFGYGMNTPGWHATSGAVTK